MCINRYLKNIENYLKLLELKNYLESWDHAPFIEIHC